MIDFDLFRFVPFRLNRLSAEVSAALSAEYKDRHGLDIPEWRIIATLGFRGTNCSAQFISQCTRTHKSTISRAVTSLLDRKLIQRIESKDDGRAFELGLTTAGTRLYNELVPRLLEREDLILSCLTQSEQRQFRQILSKLEVSLSLVQDRH